ncbi:GHKL domain-containing protein [candidate division GN15 bacterium]|nr:GHKL domain-containing protein [candidate division GN15 bacterium]
MSRKHLRLPTNRRVPFLLLLTVLITIWPELVVGLQVERFTIETDRDPRYLPYEIDVTVSHPFDASALSTQHRHCVAKVSRGKGDSGVFVRIINPGSVVDHSAQIQVFAYPLAQKTLSDQGLWMTISDFRARYDSLTDDVVIIGCGNRNDSAFAFKVNSSGTIRETLFLTTGVDRTGNGRWNGLPFIQLVADYDFDGVTEFFFWVDPQRDLQPRVLFCATANPFAVVWSTPVSSSMSSAMAFACGDSTTPAVVITTRGPANGAADDYFDDRFGYLTRLDTHGNINWHVKIARFPQRVSACVAPTGNQFYLLHSRPVDAAPDDTGGFDIPRVSLVTDKGEVLNSVPLREEGQYVWTADDDLNGGSDVYVLQHGGVISIFDSALQLKAESGESNINHFQGVLPSFGHHGPAFVMGTCSQLVVYSANFEKLAEIEDAQRIHPIEYDARGQMRGFVASGPRLDVARINDRQWYDHLAIVYLDYQNYILAGLFAAVVGLFLISYYGRKTRRNLGIIRAQKAELEQTHQALKEAQAQLVAQEKFRQARDIAGGFAHEIRNALFPARGILSRLRRTELPETTRGLLKSANHAISNAIDITSQITDYTRLDAEHQSGKTLIGDVIRTALAALDFRISEMHVRITVNGPDNATTSVNARQLDTVMCNLLRNSLDALANRDTPMIDIAWELVGEHIRLTVFDNGEGIPAEHIERVFDMFYSTRPDTGTGIGLSLVKKIVEMYGGDVSCTSRLNEGTTFTLRLPKAT